MREGWKEWLDGVSLEVGNHDSIDQGACVMEAAAFVAGRAHTDHPPCVSKVLGSYCRPLNDWLDAPNRQRLKDYIPRLLNTAADGKDEMRGYIAADYAVRVFAPIAFDAVGLIEHATALRALSPIVDKATAAAVAAAAAAVAAAAVAAVAVAATAAATAAATYQQYQDIMDKSFELLDKLIAG